MKRKSEIFLLVVIIALSVYLLFLAKSLVVPFITATILSIVIYPFYKKILLRTKREYLSAFLTVIILTIVVIVPLIFLIIGLVGQGVDLYNGIRTTAAEEGVSNLRSSINTFTSPLGIDLEQSSDGLIESAISNTREAIFNSAQFVSQKLAKFVIEAIFTVFFMFYLLIYGRRGYKYVEMAIPLKPKNKKLLKTETYNNIRALFLGQGLVALIQGGIGWIGFLVFGIDNALFWGFVMAILSFVPVVGAYIVWVPIALIEAIQGNYFGGIGLALWGVILISNIDNILRPFLVSSFSKIHFLVILIGVFIGVQAFDLIGLILGPLIIAIVITLAKIYYAEHVKTRSMSK